MRILIVSNFYPPFAVGGAEIVAHRHARALLARGHEVCVFAGRPPRAGQNGGEMEFDLIDGVEVHSIALRSLEPERAFRWEAAGRAFRAVALHAAPDVVHFNNLAGLGVNLILEAKQLGLPTVCTVHDHWGYCARNTLLRPEGFVCRNTEDCHFCTPNAVDEAGKALPFRLARDYVRVCLSLVDQLVFPSRYLADAYRSEGFDGARMRVQSNGVDLSRFDAPRGSEGSPLRIAVVGYLGKHKGFELLFEALDLLLAEPRLAGKWKIAIAGDGHLRKKIADLAGQPAYRDHVDFLGRLDQEEIPKLMTWADVVLLPSVWPENEPVVMLEAIAAGAAQIASGIGGHVDLVDDGRSGLLFASGDAQALAAGIARYVDNPEEARTHGAYNRARRSAFAQDAAVAAYENIYRAEPATRNTEDTIILCDGGWPTQEVAQLFNNFALFERKSRIRFVTADWADAQLWDRASALFLWSDERRTSMLARALRSGLTVLAPSGAGAFEFIQREGGASIGYAGFGEAIAAVLAIAEIAPTRQPRADLADNLAAIAEAESFALSAEHPAI
ncbi:MAG: glycosyltransferase [Rhodoblastus sp.]|nr:glycosyltransferase [Rhodoblastus sp.]